MSQGNYYPKLMAGLVSVLIESAVAVFGGVHHVNIVGGHGRPVAGDGGATSVLAVAPPSSSMYSEFSEL